MNPNALRLIDGNNYARLVFETDKTGFAIRRLFTEIVEDRRPTMVVFDGKNAKASRREIFPGYKVGRPPAPDQFYRVMNFWKELLMHTHAIQIEAAGYEADDFIAYLCRGTTTPIDINSTDGDFLVLVNDLVTHPGAKLPEGVSVKDMRLYKTLAGDNSDKIPGIRLFKDKSFLELTEATKTEIIKFLNGEQEWTHCFRRELHNNWVAENTPLLRAFWKVVDFMPIPEGLLNSSMRFGQLNLSLAERKLSDVMQGKEHAPQEHTSLGVSSSGKFSMS